MNKNKIQKHIDNWHSYRWQELDILTRELIESEGEFTRTKEEYANWHEAAIMVNKAKAFYEEATQDEKIEAQQKLSECDLSKNPYQQMLPLNYHILSARYDTIVRGDLERVADFLSDDEYDDESDFQKHIKCLRDSAEELKNEPHVAKQLTEEADQMEGDLLDIIEEINRLMES